MDDFILIHEDKQYLEFCLQVIKSHIAGLKLQLSTKKTQLFPLSHGIKFLGFRFYLTESGKVVRKILNENINHERRKLKKLFHRVEEGIMTLDDVECCFTSWKAHAERGNTHNAIERLEDYYNKLRRELL